ncbi:MAG: TRAP transporter large permease subunit [Bryobacterales bacterium]|nr:TRAP transporter large permease subunit [Bryobacterales bacterium]
MKFQNGVVSAALAALMVLPILEALLRKTLHTGLSGSAALVQHCTLVAGMMGAVIAARENRLPWLSTLGTLLKGRSRIAARIFGGACAAGVSVLLAAASIQFLGAEFRSGQTLAYGIPLWVVESVIPAGLALITLYLLWHAAESWTARAATAVLAAVWVVVWSFSPLSALVALALATFAGIPAFATLGGVALVLFGRAGEPIASIPIAHYSLITNPALPTIPLFTLAGYLLAEGGAPRRMVRVFQALFGPLRGGAVIVTAVVCAFFTSFTGGSGVTIIALGGLLMPVLLARHFEERAALGLITGAGSLGMLFPPCLPLILYAVVAKVPIQSMFLGGIVPGIVLLVATVMWGMLSQSRDDRDPAAAFNRTAATEALWEAKWELLMPVVALGALFGGFATPVEAAALTALYALFIETFVYRGLKLTSDVPRVMTECGLLVGGVLLIQGVALGLTNYLVDADVTAHAAEWATRTIHSPLVFLLALNAFLLVVGCMMEIYAAIVIQAPLIVTLGAAFGIDPVHLGIVFLANLELGYLTPPVGLNLLLSSYRFNKSVPEVLRAVTPLTVVMGVGVLLITYVPALTTALPRWLGH